MTLSKEEKINLNNTRMQKAAEFLRDAEANYNESRLKTSVNRSYNRFTTNNDDQRTKHSMRNL